ncbi:tetratricopeptide repeat-containing protein [Anthocerotibacter panamensis]|uniref:tetratricopeptide repeat-containing protein n=1 Tax=Anthocerotibacter panamensis TaxID=2857077 RepID=UPI001C4060B9|nr:tetratricopeptide repeat-containing protein [Anthocerotibacter panamensis]
MPTKTEEIKKHNEKNYDDLIVSIEAAQGRLNLLIAVCDDSRLRDEMINRYERELEPQGIHSYRITFEREEPSLRYAIAQLVERDEYLSNHHQAVLSVIGTAGLYTLRLGAERSEEEKFFGYLQWTREGLREFPFPIVLWVTNSLVTALSRRAPDFWGWRNGVFKFIPEPRVQVQGTDGIENPVMIETLTAQSTELNLPLEYLQQLVNQQDKQGEQSTTLYATLGRAYSLRAESGKSKSYREDIEKAQEYFQKAIALDEESSTLAANLNNLANLYSSQGRYDEAEPLYVQALALYRKLLGEEHPDVASSLNNLAGLYYSQGRYDEAEPLLQQALRLVRKLGEEHPKVAISLNNLAGLYYSQGRYDEAEPLYVQALGLRRKLLGEEHPDVATSLNNLAELYKSQGRYEQAEPLYQQALGLYRKLLGEEHPDVASSLNNLANLYSSQGRYEQAEPLLVQALAIRERVLGVAHPYTVATRRWLERVRGLRISQ